MCDRTRSREINRLKVHAVLANDPGQTRRGEREIAVTAPNFRDAQTPLIWTGYFGVLNLLSGSRILLLRLFDESEADRQKQQRNRTATNQLVQVVTINGTILGQGNSRATKDHKTAQRGENDTGRLHGVFGDFCRTIQCRHLAGDTKLR